MIFRIAVRNLFRNKRRTLIVLTSVIAGTIAIILNDSVGNGMVKQMLENQINLHTAYIQIHNKGFSDEKSVDRYIKNQEYIDSLLSSNSDIKFYSKRIITFGLLNSANSSSGVNIIGIEPEKEQFVTFIKRSLLEGNYPQTGKRDILIGKKMSEKLEVEVGDKVVAVSNTLDGTVKSELFRVCGIYQAGSSEFENTNVYIPIDFADSFIEMNRGVHEYAIITESLDDVDKTQSSLINQLGSDYELLNYRELLPLLVSYVDVYRKTVIVFYTIIGLAVFFGIVNTMLMSVMERIQEFGVLMSIGMKTKEIFKMVILESFVIGIVGTIIGFVIGNIIYSYFHYNGIDLRAFSESLHSLGINAIIYPSLNLQLVINSLLVMPVTSVLGAIYPALKATKLMPTDAMRYV